MSTPAARIQNDVTAALKAGDRERLSVLRMLLSEIKNDAIRRGEETDEDGFVALVRKGIKQRRESAQQFERGDRAELAAKETREAAMLEGYLPQQAGEDEVKAAIQEVILAEELSGPAAIGSLMKALMARFRGTADGAMVNRLAREALAEPTDDD